MYLYCFGLGFVGSAVARQMLIHGWKVGGTTRSFEKWELLNSQGIKTDVFPGNDERYCPVPTDVTHLLLSIPPDIDGDLIYSRYQKIIRALPHLRWIGYLSTTGVYGDHKGQWVSEQTPTNPCHLKAKNRVTAENQWLFSGLPVNIFRLAGIYGPGRSAIDLLKQGVARRIDKKGQVFSRIHVTDIVQVLIASMEYPGLGEIYNCADDEPEAQEKVILYAATLMGIEPPPLVPYKEAVLSPMAQQFYSGCRRVSNNKVKQELAIRLAYPNYREGLSAIWQLYQEGYHAEYC